MCLSERTAISGSIRSPPGSLLSAKRASIEQRLARVDARARPAGTLLQGKDALH